MITLDSLVQRVSPDVLGCPDPVIKQALKLAAQDFFRQTELWRVECDAVTTVGEASVELDIPANTTLVAPYQVYADGALIDQTHPEFAGAGLDDWMVRTEPKMRGYWLDSPTTIRVWPINSVAQDITAYVSVAPTLTCEQLPDVALPHEQTLVYGALWKLQSAENKVWANPAAGQVNGGLFNSGMVQAKIFAISHGMGALHVAKRRYG